MRPRSFARAHFVILLVVLGCLPVSGCDRDQSPNKFANRDQIPREDVHQEAKKPRSDSLKNEIPANQLDQVIRAHYQGLGSMERYEYRNAVDFFREVHERAPGWIPGSVNLAIALLNDTGTKAESKKSRGGQTGEANFDRALTLLNEVIGRDEENLNAHYCRGLILEYLAKTAEANRDFVFVAERDPSDGHVWLKVGSTLTNVENPDQPVGLKDAPRLVEIYKKALKCNPYLVTAYYRLQQAYGWTGQRQEQMGLLATWKKLYPKINPAGPGDTAEAFYGESGRYAKIINPFPPLKKMEVSSSPPRFDLPEPLKVTLSAGERWIEERDFDGSDSVFGRVRRRFGAAVGSFDADGDGKLDLLLAASVKGPAGLHDALLINQGDGHFRDESARWGLTRHASVGVAAADFDADRRIDLFLTGPTGYRLMRNVGSKFEDVTEKAGMSKVGAFGLTARWLDLDQDGDLDLFVVNYTDQPSSLRAFGAAVVPPSTNVAFRNDGRPAPIKGPPQDNWAPLAVATSELQAKEGLSIVFTPWPDPSALVGPPAHNTALAAFDVDDDRDLDLILSAEESTASLRCVLNDRLGMFHVASTPGLVDAGSVDGLLSVDLDKDGRTDLVATNGKGNTHAWRNIRDTSRVPNGSTWERWPVQPTALAAATAIDLDMDSWPDLVGVPARGEAARLSWLRNDGSRLSEGLPAFGPGVAGFHSTDGFAVVNLVGDALPDLVTVGPGRPPHISRNLGNGQHWLALDLGGRWKTSFDHMRTNPHGIGTRVSLEGQGLLATGEHTTSSAGLVQSVGPFYLGMGKSLSAELIRLRWPDGTIQCELNKAADIQLALTETNRKTGSCPVLFTWNGDRFVCLGDFLGGGGLGYLLAPGVYGQPDRDESVMIASDQLIPVDGVLRLSITEPMDEVAYLERIRLVAVDRPPGVSVTADERFAPEGPRPSGNVIAWTKAVAPEHASDLSGRDMMRRLAAWDRDTVDTFRLREGWVGYAETHGIVLDFGTRLSEFGPKDRLVLALAGWVEYPYSQTNYAAATAGVVLVPPSIERRQEDGSWRVIEPNAGYPAGLPRMTTLDLTGKLTGSRCVLRLSTNMECYWDQAFVAVRDAAAEASLRQSSLSARRAVLGHRGYTREVSPDGRLPLLYDYDHVDPAPLALMAGNLTRHGDVRDLLADDDDRLCLVGPGDEVKLEFDARDLPRLPPDWTRSYVLKTVGYCKDADPFTATSDRVDPLPWQRMPAFPFSSAAHRPVDASYREYLRSYQTRPAGER